jgi:hypothetical protein
MLVGLGLLARPFGIDGLAQSNQQVAAGSKVSASDGARGSSTALLAEYTISGNR